MPAPFIDRQLLERLERLTIHWQKSFRGLVGGHNESRFSGPGIEFLDHRRFHQGDDLRAAEAALEGAPPSEEVAAVAAATLAAEIAPIDDVRSTAEYRREVAGRVLHRIVRDAGGW